MTTTATTRVCAQCGKDRPLAHFGAQEVCKYCRRTLAYTDPPERRCPACARVFRVLDDAGELLPREQRQWDLVRAPRYKGGYRWRDMCRACSNAARVELARARARRRENTVEAPGGRVTLTERQAAQLAGVSLSTVTRARRKGALPRELTPAAVEAWASRRRGEG